MIFTNPDIHLRICKKFQESLDSASYLFDDTHRSSKLQGCLHFDFFGYNSELELLYRGRLDDRKTSRQMSANSSDLFKGMIEIARTGKLPLNQIPSGMFN